MTAARIVVACRLPGAMGFDDRPAEAVGRLEKVVEQAVVLGGVLVAQSYDSIAFSWDEDAIQEAVSLATRMTHAPREGEPVWACGIASGDLETGKGAALQWGKPLAVASALARVAKPREVLVDSSISAVASHELLTNRARVGRVGGKIVRGFRLDSRQVWRALAAADVARMVDPPLIGREQELGRIMAVTNVIILRADSGFGGSRMLAEVAAKTKPSRSLTLTPFSGVHEPLGSLRRAMAFVAATERITLPPNLHPVLDHLLGAEGVTVEDAAMLIAHQVQRRQGMPVPSVLLDDATDLDEPSIEACARAIELLGGEVRVVARIDSMSQLPRSLARFSDGEEVTLGRLESELAQELAGMCTGDGLERGARVQWARRGGGTPLGVVEAVAAGIARGELLWSKDVLARLKRTAGSDIARPVGYWIARRAEALRETSRDVLIALAHLGGEASAGELVNVVSAVAPEIDLQSEVVVLRRGRWIRESRPGVFVLGTRAQREAILEFSRNSHAHDWRTAVAKTLERAPGTLRRAEAAQHAARAGMGEWASRLAMSAARTASQAGLEESASTLAAFAGAQNPGSDDLDLGALAIDEDATLVAGAGLDVDALLAADALAAEAAAALLADDDVVIDLVPAKDDVVIDLVTTPKKGVPAVAAQAKAPASLPPEPDGPPLVPVDYHELLDAARDLRETRWAELARRSLALENGPAIQRRGLLALARAYANEGRSAEALIHGLDALARMKEGRDVKGARTCLLFLARIFERTEHQPEAATLKHAARAGA